jgi:hypothetical protein
MRAAWMPITLRDIVRLHASTREENMGYARKGRGIGTRKAALFIGALFLTALHMPAVGGVPYGAKMSYAFTKDPDGFTIEILQFHK